jgi:hypothetical protein
MRMGEENIGENDALLGARLGTSGGEEGRILDEGARFGHVRRVGGRAGG